jgi:hypothetical protein
MISVPVPATDVNGVTGEGERDRRSSPRRRDGLMDRDRPCEDYRNRRR